METERKRTGPRLGAPNRLSFVLALLFFAMASPRGPVPATTAVAAGVIDFAPQTRYAVSDPPTAVMVTDLAADGLQDLLASGGGWAAGFIGRGDGTFVPHAPFYPGGNVALAPGDFNGDGNEDLAVVIPASVYYNCYCVCHPTCGCADGECCCKNCKTGCDLVSVPGYLKVFLGTGDGGFLPYGDAISGGNDPVGVALGDFDQDGHQDLVVTSIEHLSLFFGKGDGTFGSEHKIATDGDLSLLSVGDLNGDGAEDLVATSHAGNQVAVLLGTGRGAFGSPVRFATGDGPGGAMIGDFDGDHRADLVVPNFGSSDVSILLGNGDGTFAPQSRLKVGPSPTAVALADFDRDGRIDLAVTSAGGNDIWVLPGNGDATFGPAKVFAVGIGPGSVATGDFNRDGWPDLAVADRDSRDISILLNLANQLDCVLVPRTCDDGNVCTDDSCDPSVGCIHVDNLSACDDGNACTVGDTCQAGACRGTGLKDADGDGHPDALCGGTDCNDLDPLVWSVPIEVTNLLLATAPDHLTWDSQGTLAGPGTLYDLVSGSVNLVSNGLMTDPICLQSTQDSAFSDSRSDPPAGMGYWYLVRARNYCGTGTFGSPLWDAVAPACP